MSERQPTPRRNKALGLKERLQFTGWLQYVPTLVVAVVVGVTALAVSLLGAPGIIVWPITAVSAALALAFVSDVLTVKLGLRPAEAVPPPLTHLDVFDLMRARRSCRSFQSRPLTAAHRAELLAAVARETRPDVLIGEHPIRFAYVAAPLTVWPVVGAHEFLVAIAPRAYSRTAVVDVGRSLQKVVVHATRMGLATCWIGPGADQKSVERHLGDRFNPDEDHIICVCAVGYASMFKPLVVRFISGIQHHRLPLRALFFADPALSQPLPVTEPPFNAFGRCYEACEWSPSSFNGQTTRCAAVVDVADGAPRVRRFDFYAATPSRFYAPIALGIWCADWEIGCEALGITGHFATLPHEAHGAADPAVPHADVSWVAGPPSSSAPQVASALTAAAAAVG